MTRVVTLAPVLLVAAGLALPPAAGSPAEPIGPVAPDAPAMQGHAAESRLRDAQAEAVHRRLFFDEAMAEAGTPGVSCDHRVASRPDTAAGTGTVSIVWRWSDGRVVARLWQSPDAALPPAEAAGRLDIMARLAIGGAQADDLVTETRSFAWCR